MVAFPDADTVLWPPHTGMHKKEWVGGVREEKERGGREEGEKKEKEL